MFTKSCSRVALLLNIFWPVEAGRSGCCRYQSRERWSRDRSPRTRRRGTLAIIIKPENGSAKFQNQENCGTTPTVQRVVVRKLAQRAIRLGPCRLSWTARERVSGVTHTWSASKASRHTKPVRHVSGPDGPPLGLRLEPASMLS